MFSKSAGGRQWGQFYANARLIGIITVISVSIFSFALFFYIQQQAQEDVKTGLFERHKETQIDATRRISEHVGSDLNLIVNTLEGLGNSYYLQKGDFYSENAKSLILGKYNELNPRINRLLILDENNVVTVSYSPRTLESFLSADLSLRDWVIETRKSTQVVFSDGFERQGLYSIYLSYPIINKDTGQFLGIIAIAVPTVHYFSSYANLLDINSQFLTVFNREGILLEVGASQELVGMSFFGNETQEFINHSPILNNLTRSLLEGDSGYAVYDYGRGERITTQSPVYVRGQPLYFLQVVTPTAQIYTELDEVLQGERIKFFLLLLGTLISVAVLAAFLIRWNATLRREVQSRTKELATANDLMQRNLNSQKEFLAIAAHELRTPVQPILGLAEVLQARAIESTINGPAALSIIGLREGQLLDVIVRNARKLQKLTEDLLDASRIDSGSLRLNRERFDLSETVASTLQDFASCIEATNKISVIGVPADAMIVNADRQRIVQVLSNLLNNSQKFVKEGTIHVGIMKEDGNVKVTIRDDGEGIHPEVFPRLFAKFVTRSERGTGLGLFISRGIIEAHDGKIWAENNQEGKGASFHFMLPLAS